MRQVVVITGASAGVGRATARMFAERGARIGLIARGPEGLEATAKEVEAAGGTALIVPADVADADQVDAAARTIEEQLGPIDVWVNDAMTSVFAPFTEVGADEFRRVTDVTYHGFVNGTRAALRHMLPRDRGVIVQVGSALAFRGIPLQSAYCGAKHAMQGFTESVRCELYHQGSRVRIGIVHLPAVNTPQFGWVLSRLPHRAQPVPPIFQPEVPAAAIVHMAEHPRRAMWLCWPTVRAILGNRVAPGVLDVYLGWKGVGSQQTSEPTDPERPANLWQPVAGDHGAHGSFDGRASATSRMAWITTHRPSLDGLRTGVARFLARRTQASMSAQ
jgi:NAD(P)-dependent dehydrogenase (short-subunit alcohol dehydrogenase family)